MKPTNLDVVYFELNNWWAGDDYPDHEPFSTWMRDDTLQFSNEEWVKENRLCVSATAIDMSINFNVTALRSWVEENCPSLLNEDIKFCGELDENGEPSLRLGIRYLDYCEENIGIHYDEWEDFYNEDGTRKEV